MDEKYVPSATKPPSAAEAAAAAKALEDAQKAAKQVSQSMFFFSAVLFSFSKIYINYIITVIYYYIMNTRLVKLRLLVLLR